MKFDPEYQLRAMNISGASNRLEVAYHQGRHDGIDYARKQVAWLVVILSVLFMLFGG